MSQTQFLVLLDTDKIHEYVFATNTLKEIRGASSLLDELNYNMIFFKLQDFGIGNYDYNKQKRKWIHNNKTISMNNINWEVIFLGGGSGKIFFSQQDIAQQFCREINELYQKETSGAATITTAIVAKNASEEFRHFIYRGEKELRKEKDSKYFFLQPITHPYFKKCESTGVNPSEVIGEEDGKLICLASYIKRQQKKVKGGAFFEKFIEFLQNTRNVELQKENKESWKHIIKSKDFEIYLPKDLNDIGVLSNNYIGLIYADGNRMGERLAKSNDSKEYRDLSDTVRKEIQDSLFNSLASHLDENAGHGQRRFPFEILLLGGDDLIVVTPANKVIEIAIDFCNDFKERTKKKTDSISISAGVVITHANYPIHLTIKHAEDLLKSAKRKSNEKRSEEVCVIDFMVIKGAFLKDIQEMREKELSYFSDDYHGTEPNIKLYQRPYTTYELAEIVRKIRRLKGDEGVCPKNKLISMYSALFRGKAQATLDYLTILNRLDKNRARKVIMEEFFTNYDLFPWIKKDNDKLETQFLDLIELYDFIDEKKSKVVYS